MNHNNESDENTISSIVARAQLSGWLKYHLKVTNSRLEENLLYHREIAQKASLSQKLMRIHDFTMLVGYFAQLEAYLTDVITELLSSFPEKMSEKEMKVESLLEAGTIYRAMRQMADRTAGNLVKGPISEIARKTLVKFGAKDKMEESLISSLDKMKAQRNLFVHNAGKADEQYVYRFERNEIMKVGCQIDPPPVEDVHHAVSQFIQDFHNFGPAKYLEWGKAKAFKSMWQQTLLEREIPFDQIWEYYPEDDMVRPQKNSRDPRDLSYYEQVVYNFFLGIYGTTEKAWLPDLINRFDRSYPERKIVDAWLENPFFF